MIALDLASKPSAENLFAIPSKLSQENIFAIFSNFFQNPLAIPSKMALEIPVANLKNVSVSSSGNFLRNFSGDFHQNFVGSSIENFIDSFFDFFKRQFLQDFFFEVDSAIPFSNFFVNSSGYRNSIMSFFRLILNSVTPKELSEKIPKKFPKVDFKYSSLVH